MLPRHPALGRFDILQELSPESGHRLLLGRSKGGKLAAIEVLASSPIKEDVSTALSKQASLAARLSDESVIQMRALILEPDFAALVTEFVEGVSLQRLLRFASARGVRLPDAAAFYVLERVLAAVHYAHAQKDERGTVAPLVHGSISPSSVIVGWDGTIKLGSFGLGRMRAVTGQSPDPTVIMAPEQARGSAETVETDVFLTALIALRVLTGRTPYARHQKSAAQRMIAMSEGEVSRLARTRPDLPAPLRDAFDRALAADPTARNVTAKDLLDLVRSHNDAARGREALVKLIGRWREQLETSVTPWERRASIPDGVEPRQGDVRDGVLALATPDERPSTEQLVSDSAPDEPWKKDVVPKDEVALAATDPMTSLSRVGATAEEALTMPPLPPMRMTMPSLPTYGVTEQGEAVRVPETQVTIPEQKFFSGGRAAAIVAIVFIALIAGAIFLLKSLMTTPTPGAN